MKKKEKNGMTNTRCVLKTDKSWTDYRTLTKIGLSANIDRPCNYTPNILLYSIKGLSSGSKACTKELKSVGCTGFLGRTG